MTIQALQAVYRVSNDDLATLLQNWVIKEENLSVLIEEYSEMIIKRMKEDDIPQLAKRLLEALQ